MARTDSLDNFLTDVAESIRLKRGITTKIAASEYDTYIENIETKADPILQMKSVKPTTAIQEIKPDDGYDALSKVFVNAVNSDIDSNIQDYNIKKGVSILGVEGSLVSEEPEGTIEITSNGSYDVKSYANAKVTVGENAITKGVIINTCNSNGYPTVITLMDMASIPESFFGTPGSMWGALKTIHMNETTYINNYAFQNLSSVVTVNMPNVTFIGLRAFGSCEKLNIPQLPDVLETIATDAFYGCKALILGQLPAALKSIGSQAFYQCSKLQLNELPEGLETIRSNAFYYCKAITINTLPRTLTTLEENAFKGCSSITSMTIPSNITNMPSYCFQSCSALKELYFEGDTDINCYYPFSWCPFEKIVFENATKVPIISTTAFGNINSLKDGGTCVIYVPDSLVDEWKTAENWTTYANFIKPLSEMV